MHLTALDDAAWSSPWRRIRVGEKVAVSGALLLTALLTPAWPGCVAVACLAVAFTCGWARIPARVLVMAFTPPLVFLMVGGLSVMVVIGGTPSPDAAVLGPAWVDAVSMERGLSAFAHGVAGTLSLLMLATTTPMSDLLAWLQRRGVPAPLVDVAALMYRLLWVLLATALAIHEAQVARLGDAPRGPGRLQRRLRLAADAMGSTLIRAWHRSARLQAGLEGRGYTDDLRTITTTRVASPRFVAVGAFAVAAVWAAVLAAQVVTP